MDAQTTLAEIKNTFRTALCRFLYLPRTASNEAVNFGWLCILPFSDFVSGFRHILAYLDDIYIVCDKDAVVNILADTRAILHDVCHIDVNLGKLVAWSRTVSAAPAGLERFGNGICKADLMPDQQGLKVLGTPIGTP